LREFSGYTADDFAGTVMACRVCYRTKLVRMEDCWVKCLKIEPAPRGVMP
jgi:hypothetical protein